MVKVWILLKCFDGIASPELVKISRDKKEIYRMLNDNDNMNANLSYHILEGTLND